MRSLIPIVLLALAGWFVVGPRAAPTGRGEPIRVSAERLDGRPPRTRPADPTRLRVGAATLTCNECHRLFDTAEQPPAQRAQHQEIALDHGLNADCLNCHDRDDRERLVLRGGESVPLAEAETLCAQCHGPTWRDVQRGVHGRSTGSWDPDNSARGRLTCTECHDPHRPAFPGIAPLPAPASTRGAHDDPGDLTVIESPLRRWRPRPGAGRHEVHPTDAAVDGHQGEESSDG